MNGPNWFWDPIDTFVGLFTKEGRRSMSGFLLLLLSGTAVAITAVYILTGHGPLI